MRITSQNKVTIDRTHWLWCGFTTIRFLTMNGTETTLTELPNKFAITELVNRLFMYTDDRKCAPLFLSNQTK